MTLRSLLSRPCLDAGGRIVEVLFIERNRPIDIDSVHRKCEAAQVRTSSRRIPILWVFCYRRVVGLDTFAFYEETQYVGLLLFCFERSYGPCMGSGGHLTLPDPVSVIPISIPFSISFWGHDHDARKSTARQSSGAAIPT